MSERVRISENERSLVTVSDWFSEREGESL